MSRKGEFSWILSQETRTDVPSERLSRLRARLSLSEHSFKPPRCQEVYYTILRGGMPWEECQ